MKTGDIKKTMSKKKKFDPFNHAMDTIKLQSGVAIGGMMVEHLNVQTGSHVDTAPAMRMMNTLPMLHASGGVFQSLNELGRSVKKKR